MKQTNTEDTMEKELKKALMEASKWQEQLTEHERTKISYAQAREAVLERIFNKYKTKITTTK